LLPKPEQYQVDDADIVIVAYGSTARSAKKAVQIARNGGIKAGLFRLRTIWPFPDQLLAEVTKDKEVVVVEMSAGQLNWPVERFLRRRVEHISYLRGRIPPPSLILSKIQEVHP
jgi:2-oxoglutarate ferredoxin oxidoreductase subunit alpha